MRTPRGLRKQYRTYQEAETATAQPIVVTCPSCGCRDYLTNDEGLCAYCTKTLRRKIKCLGCKRQTSLVNGFCGVCRGIRINPDKPMSTQQALYDLDDKRESVPGGKRIPLRIAAAETLRRKR